MEMNTTSNKIVMVAFACVIGCIGILSYYMALTFKDFVRRNRMNSHDALTMDSIEDVVSDSCCDHPPSVDAQLPAHLDLTPANPDDMIIDNDSDHDMNDEKSVEEDEKSVEEDEKSVEEDEKSVEEDEVLENSENMHTSLRLDIDALHERLEHQSADLQEVNSRISALIHDRVKMSDDMHDTRLNDLNQIVEKNATLVESKVNTELAKITAAVSALEQKLAAEIVSKSKTAEVEKKIHNLELSLQKSLEALPPVEMLSVSDVSRMISTALEANKFVSRADLEQNDKRTQIQKNVYQAWNGTAKWVGTPEFPEGSLFIQMIRQRFMTKEQNDDWLSADNKRIATHNRDSLLGLADDNWFQNSDPKIHTKRYYKDDWDSALDITITITYSKEEKNVAKTKNSTILRFLQSNGKIEWENLLVNV
jgi:CRISPR/Cas system-associated exonuclease Cas4 (RecB family)